MQVAYLNTNRRMAGTWPSVRCPWTLLQNCSSSHKSLFETPRVHGRLLEWALTRISHTFCDPEAIRSEKVSRCKSLTAAGQADPFRQTVFQPSEGRLMDIG